MSDNFVFLFRSKKMNQQKFLDQHFTLLQSLGAFHVFFVNEEDAGDPVCLVLTTSAYPISAFPRYLDGVSIKPITGKFDWE
jgi:hypothetical protein